MGRFVKRSPYWTGVQHGKDAAHGEFEEVRGVLEGRIAILEEGGIDMAIDAIGREALVNLDTALRRIAALEVENVTLKADQRKRELNLVLQACIHCRHHEGSLVGCTETVCSGARAVAKETI